MSKKSVCFYVMISIVLALSALTLSACGAAPDAKELASECVRIHIRANSNSDIDQAVKLRVRDTVTQYLTDKLENAKTKERALEILEKEKENLIKLANSALKTNGFDYGASAAISREHFPEREYGEYTFPEGEYDALIINLGSGSGDNWWCVAFPPLCFVPDGGSEKIVYKSWIKEKLDELFD